MDMLETSHSQLMAMQTMTEVVCDPQFVAHHKKVARTIYDQMAQHIGSASKCFLISMLLSGQRW
jgi:hypothetical protein